MSNLNIVFMYKGNSISIQTVSSEILTNLYKRFASKVGKNVGDLQFYFNAFEVPPCNKTLENLNLQNFNTFNVVERDVIGA